MVRELGIGGCERDLTKLAIALDRQRFEPHVGCFLPDGIRANDLRAAGVPIIEFPVRSFKSPRLAGSVWSLRTYIRRAGIGLVHTFDTPTNIFGIPAAKLAGVPVVGSQLWFPDSIEPALRPLSRLMNRLADQVVVNSDAVRRYLVEREHFSPDRLFLNHNGVETEVFYPAVGEKPEAVADASVVIGTVCALRPEKRIDLLLRAFARARSAHSGAVLLIVGSGPVEAQLRRLATELGLGNSVRMAPRQQDVARWLRAIDIFVLCSDTESFPNALLEAMACGCAVIGSRVGGVPELVADGASGLLFDAGREDQLAHQIETLLRQQDLRKQLGAEAARRAREEFSMQAVVSRMETLYERLLR